MTKKNERELNQGFQATHTTPAADPKDLDMLGKPDIVAMAKVFIQDVMPRRKKPNRKRVV